jgi:hypothetical protein
MKKKVLLIGNNRGLNGVQIDLNSYRDFFKSQVGGKWNSDEIISTMNPRKSELEAMIDKLKKESLDYLIVIFSGHGGLERETVLELNSYGEEIEESKLKYIASRQVNIFDCCRSVSESTSAIFESKSLNFSEFNLREKYEKRIMQAIPQQISLYSCAENETSNDTPTGGIYTQCLLKAARNITGPFKTVSEIQQEARNCTIEKTKNFPPKDQQHPEAILPKCLNSQELIFSINPNI